ncbi:MAG: universal stress protein [Alphaproteobacteria bacterium]|nr:universal stress protein [Alphaproteobacteria bacterium]
MTYKTLLAHLELGRPNACVLAAAKALAEKFDARVIGVAASQPIQILYAEVYAAGDLLKMDRDQIEAEIAKAQTEFQSALGPLALDWRTFVTSRPLSDCIAGEARAADLILTAPDIGGAPFEATRRTVVGDLVMRAGRPVIIAPDRKTPFASDHILVAWRDTREARRAVADAAPLLAAARKVSVVEVAGKADAPDARRRVDDVASWLSRRGIAAEAQVHLARGSDAHEIAHVAQETSADVVVAGAYGHARFQEWMFGGVTHDLLMHPTRPVFLSH